MSIEREDIPLEVDFQYYLSTQLRFRRLILRCKIHTDVELVNKTDVLFTVSLTHRIDRFSANI